MLNLSFVSNENDPQIVGRGLAPAVNTKNRPRSFASLKDDTGEGKFVQGQKRFFCKTQPFILQQFGITYRKKSYEKQICSL